MDAKNPLVIGHKGAAALAPENTLGSFALALELGVDAVECDIRATADGVPVILHDSTVDRTTSGTGEVSRLSLEQVKALEVRPVDGLGSAARVPTLEDLLALIAGKCLLVLEYKSLDAVVPSIALLRAVRAHEWCTAWSFQPAVVSALRLEAPELSRSLLIGREDDWEVNLHAAIDRECIGVSLRQEYVDSERVRRAKGLGLQVFAWTANDVADWARLVAAGVDGIVTDDPGRLKQWLGSRPD